MRFVFRVDASREIGTGHVMRCLALACALPHPRAVEFICREYVGDMCGAIEAEGFRVHRLPPTSASSVGRANGCSGWLGVAPDRDVAETISAIAATGGPRPDWLVVDHYGIDATWESAMRPYVASIFAVDDIADRPHECDLLLDQNYYSDARLRYLARVPPGTRCLLGPHFALLRPEFAAARNAFCSEPLPEKLFVSFGGHDTFRISVLVVEALKVLGRAAPAAEIVSGSDEDLRAALTALTSNTPGVRIHGYVRDMARLMSRCNFAIGAGGSSTWERCALGVPTLVVVVAENQRRTIQDLADTGVVVNLGEARDVTAESLAGAIAVLHSDGPRRRSLRTASMALVDGNGASRVVSELTGATACST